jgi:hypothetical protein
MEQIQPVLTCTSLSDTFLNHIQDFGRSFLATLGSLALGPTLIKDLLTKITKDYYLWGQYATFINYSGGK